MNRPVTALDFALDWAKRLLPLALMLGLAAGTYWLVKRALPDEEAKPAAAKRHVPDYFVEKLSATALNETGQTKYRMQAKKVVHFEDDDSTEVSQPAVRAYTPGQPATTAQADLGRLSGDAAILDLIGHAVVQRLAGADSQKQAAMQAHSETFRVFLNEDKISTDQAVTLQHGASILSANGMVYDNVPRTVQLLGNVRGQIIAAPSRPAAQ